MDRTADSGPGGAAEHIAVVIPAYKAADSIAGVVGGLPAVVRSVVVVDDASPDGLADVVRRIDDPRVHLVRHETNQGVGAATMSGYAKAAELGATVMVKMDADGQMDPERLPDLLWPVLRGEVDYAKGNRFIHVRELRDMPLVRRVGNTGLSFLSKMASGLWHIFDPTNGYTALHVCAFERLDRRGLGRRYFFETSMLIELSLAGAVVADVDIPARYGDERSSLSAGRSLLGFPLRLVRGFLRRIWVQHFVRNFGLFAVFSVTGFALLVYGVAFGLYNWIYHASVVGEGTPLGTIMLAALPIILGVQLLLQAVVLDVQDLPATSLQARARGVARLRQELAAGGAAPSLLPGSAPAAQGTRRAADASRRSVS